MTRKSITVVTLAALWLASATSYGQEQSGEADRWADYVATTYNIMPNITYATANNTEMKLDLYLPQMQANRVPVVIYFHGGGWVEGKKERNTLYLLPYLSMGWAAVNVEYRLARNSLAPAAVEDCRCALRWVTLHCKENNLDSTRIVLTGPSGGGHLALITGMLPDHSPFDRQCPSDESHRWKDGIEPELKIAAIINWYGITDVNDVLVEPNARHYAIEWFGSLDNRMELAKQLSPQTFVRAGLPPIITIHGDSDPIVPYAQAVKLHALLEKAGVPNQLVTIRGGGHGGFSRQDIVNSYATIREFLRKNGIIANE
jgi:acetyl esterase/lipase